MFVAHHLTDEIIEVLKIELIYWIRDGLYKTHTEFVKNLKLFANICLPDTHPNNQRLGRDIEDPDMRDYFNELTEFVNKDGFRDLFGRSYYCSKIAEMVWNSSSEESLSSA